MERRADTFILLKDVSISGDPLIGSFNPADPGLAIILLQSINFRLSQSQMGHIMEKKTLENIHTAFVGEAKAYFRLLAYAEKARQENEKQAVLLFEAIAEAERVHATRHMNMLKDIVVQDTDTNLRESLKRENSISENDYPEFLSQAVEEGESAAAYIFSQARDVEKKHAYLYEQAMYHIMRGEVEAYYVCQVCGYVNEKKAPKKCSVCGAPQEKFKKIEE
jgi:rubrerythrin